MHLSFYDVVFGFTVLSRASDLLTTWLVTPKLKLEANPLVRKLKWPFGFLTLFVAFFAYTRPELAIIFATCSFLVAGRNATMIASSRILGEDKLLETAITLAGRGGYWSGWLARMAPLPFYALFAGLILFLYPTTKAWSWYVGIGVIAYVFALLVHGTFAYNRHRKLARVRGDVVRG